jgi:hypothetical protein
MDNGVSGRRGGVGVVRAAIHLYELDWLMHEAVGFFTFLLVVVGVLQLGLFAWQLTLIRKSLADTKVAADAAKDAANAANIQAQIAERTLTEIERPWLFVAGATITRREMPNEPLVPNNWFISFRCQNAGRMPAVVEQCIIKIADKDALPPTPDYSGPVGTLRSRRGVGRN